ncbi:hypothetical protein ACEW7V_00435 [Areca yellow leaf disease phytoplasma]|uniref:hypothetical protein n=1 Tax=Areca yellow leaf disease phytoplasma TaxID=927614 RepID=UPI0035B54C43
MIIVIREFLVTGIRLVASNKEGVVISASFWGQSQNRFYIRCHHLPFLGCILLLLLFVMQI